MDRMLRHEITTFVATSRENRFAASGEPYFDAPLIGFAAAADPLFTTYKEIIGAFHRSPEELLAGAATVICWVLPIPRATRASNRTEEQWPSRQWALTRHHGENFNMALRRHLVGAPRGLRRRARDLQPERRAHYSARDCPSSRQRDHRPDPSCHAAYGSGSSPQLSVVSRGELWPVHQPLPGRGHRPCRARQDHLPGVRLRHRRRSGGGSLRCHPDRLRPVPDAGAVRGADSARETCTNPVKCCRQAPVPAWQSVA